jgi:hypothetical protein
VTGAQICVITPAFVPANSGAAMPTMVKGAPFRRMVEPTTSGRPS